MKYLIASFIMTNVLHSWLVLLHWGENPASLSYHTLKSRLVYITYATGHIVAAGLLGLVVLTEFKGVLVLAIAGIAVITECLQAVLPAKGKTDKLHTVFAVIMAFSLALLVLVCTILFAPSKLILSINLVISLVVFSFFFVTKYPPAKGTWKFQFVGQFLLYLQMFLVLK